VANVFNLNTFILNVLDKVDISHM
jgi:hypothetical protein